MKEQKKKKYISPELYTIPIDRDIALVMQTQNEDEPPNPPLTSDGSGTSTSSTESTEEPLKTNNFEENPFQR
jgi:hypothetical protein